MSRHFEHSASSFFFFFAESEIGNLQFCSLLNLFNNPVVSALKLETRNFQSTYYLCDYRITSKDTQFIILHFFTDHFKHLKSYPRWASVLSEISLS